ncbi:uncharacterized protein LOC129258025 [Lytechinus pictus]|uniref:uncharacterized protein LOC129258025 n=1 Tax=Lytechinus pictus TaxID=7653 RepID=UPI0030B9E36D
MIWDDKKGIPAKISDNGEEERLDKTNMDLRHQRSTDPESISSIEVIGMASMISHRGLKSWDTTSSYSVSVVNGNDDDVEREHDKCNSLTRRRIPRWVFCSALIVTSLLVATLLVTLSVIPMLGLETTTMMTMTTLNSINTPAAIVTDEEANACLSGEFWCGDDTNIPECIPGEWRCDGEIDCTTGRDEKYCEDSSVITNTTKEPRPCVAWQQTFNESCGGQNSSAGCVYIPQCHADGSRWTITQCTSDRRSCWCVDQNDGRTIAETFTGVDVLIDGEVLDCP